MREEKCGAFLNKITLSFIGFVLSLGTALAGEVQNLKAPVYLAPQGIVESEQYTSEMLSQIQKKAETEHLNLKDYAIVLMHEGERVPAEIQWIIVHFKRAGLNVKVIRKKPGSTKQIAKNIEIEREKIANEVLLKLEYDATSDPELHKLIDQSLITQNKVSQLVQAFSLRLKEFFGLQNGVSFAMFQDSVNGIKRPEKQKTAEVLGSLPVAALVATLTWYSLHEQLLQEPALLPIAGGLAAALFQVLTAYFDRAFNAFQVQGKDYFRDRKSIDTKRKWFYLCAYSHTFFTSLAVQTAAHTFFGLNTALITHTAWNSLVALFAKVLPKMWIAKNQNSGGQIHDTQSRQDSPWRTIGLNIGFSAIYESLKYSHLLHISPILSTAFLSFGVLGLIYEGYQHFFGGKKPETVDQVEDQVEKRFKKDLRYLLSKIGLRKPTQCETLLMIRPLSDAEKLDPAGSGIL